MTPLETKFHALDRLAVPDRLGRFDDLAARIPPPELRRRTPRLAVVVLALLLSGAAIGFTAVVFGRSARPGIGPATTPPLPTETASLPTPTRTLTPPSLATGRMPPHGALVFDEVEGQSRYDIAFVEGDGTKAVPMTDSWRLDLVAGGAAWTRDGARVAFVVGARDSWRFTGDGDLYVMNADGSRAQKLTSGIGVTSPTWSPDGARIAFVRNQGTALCVIDADGSGLRVVDSGRGYYQHPRWSPLGDEIAFQSNVSRGSDRTAIFLIAADGSRERRVSPPAGDAGAGFPSWSPDGRTLAYGANDSLLRLDLSTGAVSELTRCRLPSCVTDYDPVWSPDGLRIAFIRQEDGGAATHLYLLDLSTGHVRRVGPLPYQQWSPSWRP